jgi:hypothetical protein
MIGPHYDVFKKHVEKEGSGIAAVIVVLLTLFAVAVAFFIRAKKE